MVTSRCCARGVVAVAMAVVATLLCGQAAAQARSPAGHVIVIDAGSSGSRIHVFPYFSSQNSAIAQVEKSQTLKVKPGLSSYADAPEEGGKSLVPLLDFAKQHVPMSQWKSTPVYLKATAGLRSVPPEKATQVLDACRQQLSLSHFLFHPSQAEIITGSWEGIFGWITANYLENTFTHPDTQSVGVIEMGGASMQITFEPNVVTQEDEEHLFDLSLGSRRFRIYTHSYLNYGLEAAQELFYRTHADVIQSSGNPCYHRNYKFKDFPGTGSHQQCASMIEGILDKKQCVKEPVCAFNGVYQPKITTERFYAIENFFYTTEFFELDKHPDPFANLESKGKEFCSMDWSHVPVTFHSQSSSDLSKYCFSSAYLPTVLKHGFGLQNPSQHARIVHDIGGVPIDWAMGAALYELMRSNLPQPPTTQFTPSRSDDVMVMTPAAESVFIRVLPLLAVVAVAAIVLAVYREKRRVVAALEPVEKDSIFLDRDHKIQL